MAVSKEAEETSHDAYHVGHTPYAGRARPDFSGSGETGHDGRVRKVDKRGRTKLCI